MPEEEVKYVTPEARPDVQVADFRSQPEQVVEQKEQREQGGGGKDEQQKKDSVEPVQVKTPAAAAAPSIVPVEKNPVLIDIENLLSDDLTDIFLALPDEKKWEFKQKGEETAGKIQEMILGGKVKVKKIFDLIRDWLKMVPGVNKYFLEQEAKIKADKVMLYADEQVKASQNLV